MSRRSVTRIRVEVSVTLPAGRGSNWGVDWIKGAIALAQLRDEDKALDRPLAEQVRLLSKETTYL